MEMKSGTRGLVVRADDALYRLSVDDRYLMIERTDSPDDDTRMPGEAFRQKPGNRRIPKREIDGIRCTVNAVNTEIAVVRDGRVRRFVCERLLEEQELEEVFDDIPLKIIFQNGGNRPRKRRLELGLLALCFVLGALRLVCNWVPVLRPAAMLWPLGWMAIPLVWIAVCAGYGKASEGPGVEICGFQLNSGALSWMLSSVMLWTAHEGELTRWSQLILPALGMMIPVAVCLIPAVRRLSAGQVILIAVASLLTFAPASAIYLNELLPEAATQTMPLAVVELNQVYTQGRDHYYAVAELEGVQGEYEISRENSLMLENGGTLSLVQSTGALGMEYSHLECRAAEENQ